MAEHIKDPDEYYDYQIYGLTDKKGKVVPLKEQHEFMLGYDNSDRKKCNKSSGLEIMVL